jgi:hypothetical protein
MAGKESKVKLKLGDYSGTAVLSTFGVLRVEEEKRWTAPVE